MGSTARAQYSTRTRGTSRKFESYHIYSHCLAITMYDEPPVWLLVASVGRTHSIWARQRPWTAFLTATPTLCHRHSYINPIDRKASGTPSHTWWGCYLRGIIFVLRARWRHGSSSFDWLPTTPRTLFTALSQTPTTGRRWTDGPTINHAIHKATPSRLRGYVFASQKISKHQTCCRIALWIAWFNG